MNLLLLWAGGLLDPNVGTIFWVTLIFSILLFILYKFAWGPILNGLEEREKRINEALMKAEASNEEAARVMAQFDKTIKEANEKADIIIKSARETGEKIKEDMLLKSRQESEKIIEHAKAEIEHDRASMKQQLKAEMVDLIITVSGKLIDENLNKDKNRSLVENAIDDYSKN